MNSKTLSEIKNKLKKYLKDKDIFDIILFGSFAKGSILAKDIDIAVITNSKIKIENKRFHTAIIKPIDFFHKPPLIINTLLREGYSIKKNKPFSEIYGFSQKALFSYNLLNLKPSNKVKVVNALHGTKGKSGLVKSNKGEWIANQVFIVPVSNEKIFEKFFINLKINYRKNYILMH